MTSSSAAIRDGLPVPAGGLSGASERGDAALEQHARQLDERCAGLMLAEGAVSHERRAGALLQVNASSLTGRHGPDA